MIAAPSHVAARPRVFKSWLPKVPATFELIQRRRCFVWHTIPMVFSLSRFRAMVGAMPELTRRRSTDAREECWHIYYGDVHAGTIAIRSGNPHDEDPVGMALRFSIPVAIRSEHQSGTAATFDQAVPTSKPRGRYFWQTNPG